MTPAARRTRTSAVATDALATLSGTTHSDDDGGPLALPFAAWVLVAVFLALAFMNLTGKSPFPGTQQEPVPPPSPLEAVLGTDEDHEVLSFYCGPHALAEALHHVAASAGVPRFDRDAAFAGLVRDIRPVVGRGSTLLDLKRVAERAGPVTATGLRFDHAGRLLGILTERPHAAAVVHLSPAPGRAAGHFVAIYAVPASSIVSGTHPPRPSSTDESSPPARTGMPLLQSAGSPPSDFVFYDPLDGTSPRGRRLAEPDLLALVRPSATGYVLLVEPR